MLSAAARRAVALHRQRRLPEACRAFGEALAREAPSGTLHRLYGLALRDAGQAGAAVDQMKAAVVLDRDEASMRALAETLHLSGRLDEARRCLEALLARAQDSPQALRDLAALLIDQGEHHTAAALLRRALEAAPDDAACLTLFGKLYRDVFNCYSNNVHGIYYTSPGNNSTVANYPTTLNASCPATQQQNVAEALAYEPVGSGAGLNAFTFGSPTSFGSPATSNPVAYINTSTTVGASSTPYPEVEFAGSDAYLSSAQITAANAIDGLSGHPNAIFQVPTLATPVALPVGQVTGASLSLSDVCDVFSGQLKVSGNPNALQQIYVRADGSGTSFIFSEWLSLNCTGTSTQPNGKAYAFTAANGFPSTAPSWSAANVGLTTGSLATITAVSGSGGVANAIGSASYSIGYLSPDYTSLISTGPYTNVNPAKVNSLLPSLLNTNRHLSSITPPSSYTNNIGALLNDALAAKSVATTGYAIVGYTFVDTYGCYSSTYESGLIGSSAKGDAVKATLNAIYNSSFGTTATAIINASGFAGLPSNVVSLLTGTGGPLSTTGINGTQCPSGRT